MPIRKPEELFAWWQENSGPLLAQAVEVGGESISFWQRYILPILIILSVLMTIAFLVGIVYIVVKLQWFGQKKKRYSDLLNFSNLDEKRIVKAWKQIEGRVENDGEADLKLAVIEADKLLDEVLKISGYEGETMADRLKKLTPANLSNIEMVWRAHKLRNRLVHEPDYNISREEARKQVDVYRKALVEFGLIR